MELIDRFGARITQEIAPAPPVGGLEDVDRVTSAPQFADHSAQEGGVAMVPVRYQRVAEQLHVHAATASRPRWRYAAR
jgi:hypothetical protein